MTEPQTRWALLGLAAVIGLMLAGASKAQPYEENAPALAAPIAWYDGPHIPEGALGVVIHANRNSTGDTEPYLFYVGTPYGDIVVMRQDTPNMDCTPGCPDPVRVHSLPAGLIAEPDSLLTPEGQTEWIVVYPAPMF